MYTKLGIVIPVRNCLELTKAAIDSIRTRYPYQTYVVDDRSGPEMKAWLAEQDGIVCFTDPPESTGLAYNWNLGIAAALNDGCSHMLVTNNDVLFHPEAIDNLVHRMDRGDAVLVSAFNISEICQAPDDVYTYPADDTIETGHPDLSCFMVTEDTIRRVGWFDEEFIGAYYEDNDYLAAMALAHEKAVRTGAAPFYHYSLSTVKDNDDAKASIQGKAARNMHYFGRKWGRMPVNDFDAMCALYYPTPFNTGTAIRSDADRAERRLAYLYQRAQALHPGTAEQLNFLYRLASTCERVAVLGCDSQTLSAALYASPKVLHVYAQEPDIGIARLIAAARLAGIAMSIGNQDVDPEEFEPTDLLLIDARHVTQQMLNGLCCYAVRTARYIALYDPEAASRAWTCGFLRDNPAWIMWRHVPGLTVLTRTEVP